MKPAFIYIPTEDLARTATFYRDQLGFDEAWRMGESTIAFALPDSDVQLMISTDPGAHGVMYLVPSVADWRVAHPELQPEREPEEVPGGTVVEFRDSADNAFYVFDQED